MQLEDDALKLAVNRLRRAEGALPLACLTG
jgi:hypothetical protein